MRFSHNKQIGAAAIWFIFLIGAIMSLGALAIEGSRYIGKKARLGDASEAAAIAISANDGVTKGFNVNEKQRNDRSANDVAKIWIQHYVDDDKKLSIGIKRSDAEKIINRGELIPDYKLEYFKYLVTVKTTHDSWFKYESWARFNDQVVIANKAVSGRIKGGHEPVDIVYVADYSGSMNWKINNRDKYNKIDYLKNAVAGVSEKIYKTNKKSTFGFIPFTKRIVIKNNDKYYCTSPLLASEDTPYNNVKSDPTFSELLALDLRDDREKYYDTRSDRYGNKEKILAEYYVNLFRAEVSWNGYKGKYVPNKFYKDYLKSIGEEWSVYHESGYYLTSTKYNGTYKFDEPSNKDNVVGLGKLSYEVGRNKYSHVDIERTAKEISLKRKDMYPFSIPYSTYHKPHDKLQSKWSSHLRDVCTSVDENGVPNFHNLERRAYRSDSDLKSNFSNEVRGMRADGGTDMYQGLLAAPNYFDGAVNKNRYIIVLSDGEENGYNFSRLVSNGLCENIKTTLSENGKYNAKLFVIGIGLDQNKNDAYKKCFKENIITVFDPEELEKRIMGIITDDIGHNFDRYN